MKDFAGKVVVITGGAGGLGREFANAAHARGMKIVLADVEGNALEQAATPLR